MNAHSTNSLYHYNFKCKYIIKHFGNFVLLLNIKFFYIDLSSFPLLVILHIFDPRKLTYGLNPFPHLEIVIWPQFRVWSCFHILSIIFLESKQKNYFWNGAKLTLNEISWDLESIYLLLSHVTPPKFFSPQFVVPHFTFSPWI